MRLGLEIGEPAEADQVDPEVEGRSTPRPKQANDVPVDLEVMEP